MSFYLRHYLFCSASFFIGSIKSCFISTSIFRHFNSPKFLFIFTFFTEITLYTIIINYYITWFKLTTAITLIFSHVDIMNHLVPSPIFFSNNCFSFIHLSIITHCKQIIQYFSNPTFSYRNPLLSGLKSFKPNLTFFISIPKSDILECSFISDPKHLPMYPFLYRISTGTLLYPFFIRV